MLTRGRGLLLLLRWWRMVVVHHRWSPEVPSGRGGPWRHPLSRALVPARRLGTRAPEAPTRSWGTRVVHLPVAPIGLLPLRLARLVAVALPTTAAAAAAAASAAVPTAPVGTPFSHVLERGERTLRRWVECVCV